MKGTSLLPVLAAAALAMANHQYCRADGGDEGPDNTTTMSSFYYPGCEYKADDSLNRVTNDGLDRIKAFYQKTLGPYDEIKPFTDQGSFSQGFVVVYRVHYKGQQYKDVSELGEFARVEVTMPDSNGFKARVIGAEYALPEPLSSLKNLVDRFGHTQEDYDAVFNKYQWVRFIQSWDPASDGPMITQKYHEKVFGAMTKTAPQEKSGDAATRADLKQKQKKMKELQASGDMAAMMALAQEMQQEAAGTGAGEQAQQYQDQQVAGIQRDSWDDWVACLKEMARAARWTRLQYSSTSNWWSGVFWKPSTVPGKKK